MIQNTRGGELKREREREGEAGEREGIYYTAIYTIVVIISYGNILRSINIAFLNGPD